MPGLNQNTITPSTCLQCGVCADVCPNDLIAETETGMFLRTDRLSLCFACGQCMSVCPTASINITGLSYDKDFFELPKPTPYETPFFNMIATRRAVRNFKETPVPRELLEKVVKAIAFAPPGFPPLKTEIIVVQNPDVIKQALPYMVELYDFLLKAMKNPVARLFIRKEVGGKKFKQMQTHLVPLMQARLPGLKAGTEDTITRHAPAMILFHADKEEEDTREDVFVAATYCMLAVHSLGLGGSIMDLIPSAIEKKAELRKLFCIPEGHEVLASVIIGYPRYQYFRGIKRNLKSVKWI